MKIVPAIDLYDGKVVRLFKGRQEDMTVYSDDPVKTALDWEKYGAKYIHIVDLSAAFGKSDNRQIVKRIVEETGLKVEFGGGIRTISEMEELLGYGIDRLALGTMITDETFLDAAISRVGAEKIVISLDVFNSHLAVDGWRKNTATGSLDILKKLEGKGIKWVVYTDISRDGTLAGPNIKEAQALMAQTDMNFVLSGGVSSTEDLYNIKEAMPALWGVIVGKAFYENRINIENINIDNF
ncbi:MAG: 1-(5-phosphoribosyl)-5-[(5-phosphoribosylamino)methylideneamino]imidazole-4-carboxamide isomerase [Candidatus Omnitrophica bacterium]|nr:1-(5-phosphoribosyl)-5-[(5-phosphoribosylamino)methylideneamino]imidazole-4-carboxamide isomerase [Candidatus Omnitrophota bacterium]